MGWRQPPRTNGSTSWGLKTAAELLVGCEYELNEMAMVGYSSGNQLGYPFQKQFAMFPMAYLALSKKEQDR